MTREEFISKLIENKINPDIVSFNDNVKEGYCVRKNYYGWETFVRERGEEYSALTFPSESNALDSLYSELIKLYPCSGKTK